MSLLKVYDDQGNLEKTISERSTISDYLKNFGVRFEQWEAETKVSQEASQEEILQAYKGSIDRLKEERGFRSADVVNLHPQSTGKEEARQKYINEHTHLDDEARFFIDGKGLFFINAGSKIFGLMCEKDDLVNVPKNTKHWFDMGAEPFFKCIRVFTNEEGWVGHFTGDKHVEKYPLFEKFED